MNSTVRILPFITDTAEAQSIVDQLNAVITDHVLCLPAQWLGYSPHHMNFKGTVTAKSETHINMIVETASCMVSASFGRILIVNGHSGNVANMNVALKRLMEEYPEAKIYGTPWLTYDEVGEIREAGSHGWGHARELETSVMMALHPEWVKTDRRQRWRSWHESSAKSIRVSCSRGRVWLAVGGCGER